MNRMLLVTTVPEAIRAFLLPHVRHLRSNGWKVAGAARQLSQYPECVAELDESYDVMWSRNPIDPAGLWEAMRRIRSVVAQGRYDIVHVHTPIASMVTRYSIRRMRASGVRVIYTAHGFHFHSHGSWWKNRIFELLERTAGSWTDELIVINREDYLAARRLHLISEDHLHYVPGIGVDRSHYRTPPSGEGAKQKVYAELGLPPNSSLFLMMAEFTANKRHSDLLKALAGCKETSIHIAFCGVGPMMNSARLLSDELGVSGQVHFLGHREEVRDLLHASRGLVLVSGREGLSRSVLEAMCAGVPVIASEIRGNTDLLAEGGGILVRCGSIEQISAALLSLHRDPETATNMGRRGQQAAGAYDLKQVLQKFDVIYDRTLGRRIELPMEMRV